MAAVLTLYAALASAGTGAVAAPQSMLDFELRSLRDPATHALSRYGGKPVLFVFFEPECSWCLRQFRAIADIQRQCGAHFETLAIGVNADRRRLQLELHRVGAQFPAYQASPALIAAAGGVPATPILLLGDREGRQHERLRGFVPAPQLLQGLAAAGAEACGARRATVTEPGAPARMTPVTPPRRGS